MQLDPYTVACAVIAVLVVARLWFVLGRKNENDTERPNPFGAPVPGSNNSMPPLYPQGLNQKKVPEFKHPPQSLLGGLEQIKGVDTAFDEKPFLQGAKDAFTRIVAAFAAGDLSGVSKLLGPNVAPHFQAAIDARKQAGQSLHNKITRIRDAETVAANLDGTLGVITVRFVSEQENILRDASDRIIGGSLGKVEEITDVWTFSRDLKSDNPDWILAETKS